MFPMERLKTHQQYFVQQNPNRCTINVSSKITANNYSNRLFLPPARRRRRPRSHFRLLLHESKI